MFTFSGLFFRLIACVTSHEKNSLTDWSIRLEFSKNKTPNVYHRFQLQVSLDNTFGRVIILAAGRIIVKSVEWKEKKKIITRWCCCCVLPFCSVQFSSVQFFSFIFLCCIFILAVGFPLSQFGCARAHQRKEQNVAVLRHPTAHERRFHVIFVWFVFCFLFLFASKTHCTFCFLSRLDEFYDWCVFLFFISLFPSILRTRLLCCGSLLRAPIKKSRDDFSQRNRVKTINVDRDNHKTSSILYNLYSWNPSR